MASLPQQTPSPVAGDDRNLVVVDENYLAPTFEDRVRIFWERHGRTVISALVLIVIFVSARFLFGLYAEHRENAVRVAYAEAGSDTAALRAFATANPAATLAGVAWVRVADEAYAAGNYSAAAEAYASAVELLKNDPVGARARMGRAVSLLQAGDASAPSVFDGLANDTLLPAPLRAEAAYHLAVLSQEAGKTAEATRLLELAISVDTSGLWAQRATRLHERLAVASDAEPAAVAAQEEAASVTFPGANK